jgi:hypothetical protein
MTTRGTAQEPLGSGDSPASSAAGQTTAAAGGPHTGSSGSSQAHRSSGLCATAPAAVRVVDDTEAADRVVDALGDNEGADVFVDFDETLFLDNSTAAFLRSARPQFLAWLILKAVDVSRLCSLLPGPGKRHVYFDWLRVLAVCLLMPWSLPLWHLVHAPRQARQRANGPLVQALSAAGDRVTIVSLGFGPVVRPLAARIRPGTPVICGSLFTGFRMRRKGKRAVTTERFGRARVADSTVVTDSDKDDDLVTACRTPVKVTWPGVSVAAPFAGLYLPFLYTEKGKRPGRSYMLNAVLKHDVVAIGLAFAWTAPQPLVTALGLAILHLAFWTVYETGYVENDRVAARHEVRPTLAPDFQTYAARHSYAAAGLWALVLSALGVLVVGIGTDRIAADAAWRAIARDVLWLLGPWLVFLGGVYLVFRLYNGVGPERRLVLYPVLQLFRFAGYGLFGAATLVGLFLVAAVVFGRWYPYMIYRATGSRWEQHQGLLVLVTFLVLAALGVAGGHAGIIGLQGLVVILWLAVRARHDLLALGGGFTRHGADGPRGEPRR